MKQNGDSENTDVQSAAEVSPQNRQTSSSENRNQSGYTLTHEEAMAMIDRMQKGAEETMRKDGYRTERLQDGSKILVKIN